MLLLRDSVTPWPVEVKSDLGCQRVRTEIGDLPLPSHF